MKKNFTINDGFWKHYRDLVCDSVIPYQQKVLNDEIPGIEKSHAIENFRIAAGEAEGDFYGWIFQDSDVAKWIEAASYSLMYRENPQLKSDLDEVIRIIGKAQEDDGYLDTYFTISNKEKRWQNLQEAHELYCSGHMMEAATAFYDATGETSLLEIMEKNADCIYNRFGKDKHRGFPGHPEIELALVKLYRATGKDKYLELAKYFVDERGTEPSFYEEESKLRDWTVWKSDPGVREYTQAYAPVREQKDARGHAVRAVYLYTGMADVALETGDKELMTACENLWESITERQMYVTGGIGSTFDGEAFTADYDLPNDRSYAETCAAIGLIFFAKKMLEGNKDAKYSDIMEKSLYNGVLAGMSLDGKNFFYVNPLEVNPEYDGKINGYKHILPTRPGWYGCACCPPNVARLIASLDSYAWDWDDKAVYSHLFIGGKLDLTEEKGFSLELKTTQPNYGELSYTFGCENPVETTLAVRIPYWTGDTFSIKLNNEKVSYKMEKGYAYICGEFKDGDTIEISLDMNAKKIYSNPLVRDNKNSVAIQRGPIVYCLEGIDNEGDLRKLRIKKNSEIKERIYNSELLGGIVPLEAEGVRLDMGKTLYSFQNSQLEEVTLKLIPYRTWTNRGESQMTVWIGEI